jgi:hypothetical protein
MLLIELIEFLETYPKDKRIEFYLHSPVATVTQDVIFKISGGKIFLGQLVQGLRNTIGTYVKTPDQEIFIVSKYTPVWAMDGRGELFPLYPTFLAGLLDLVFTNDYGKGVSETCDKSDEVQRKEDIMKKV